MAAREGTLKATEFVHFCENELLELLGEAAPPHRRTMWITLQLHYGDPTVHFELQPHPSDHYVEIGLHFEGAVERNDTWAAVIAARTPEILGELGPDWELEAWTPSWRRLHRVVRFDALTSDLGRFVSQDLARAIRLLGPLVSEGLPTLAAAGAP